MMPKFTIVYFLYYYYKDRNNPVSEFGRQENFIDILSAKRNKTSRRMVLDEKRTERMDRVKDIFYRVIRSDIKRV